MSNHRISISINEAIDTIWDIVIVGSGMGGGTIAHALANKGFNILLIEKGLSEFDENLVKSIAEEDNQPETRLEAGKWPHKIKGIIDDAEITIWPSLGCGAGGSTLLYGAALQRLDPRDFENRTLPTGETISWPFTFKDLGPYYSQAEKMFNVCGTHDPLESDTESYLLDPPPMCEASRMFFNSFNENGLHPYRIHVGIRYHEGCDECGGKICHNSCKQTAYNCGILPALATGKLKVLDRAEVFKFESNKTKVKSLCISHHGSQYMIQGEVFILSAGAMFSPVVLLRSKNQYWPNGLANKNGLVGKNLMFHATDFIAVWPKKNVVFDGPNKTLAMRDYYYKDGIKLGEFQSSGLFAGYANVLYALRLIFDQSMLRNIPFIRHLLRIPAYIASKIFGKAAIFATILEDNPYVDNQIVIDEVEPSGMMFRYHIRKELEDRYFLFRKMIGEKLKGFRFFHMCIGVNLNYGHPSGTCRAGKDPENSVLNRDCRAHGLKNLYVVDGSFMPTSGGTNPSLTIAANALRVADIIDRKLKDS